MDTPSNNVGNEIGSPNTGDVLDNPHSKISEINAIPINHVGDFIASQYNVDNGLVIDTRIEDVKETSSNIQHSKQDTAIKSHTFNNDDIMTLDYVGPVEVNEQAINRNQVMAMINVDDRPTEEMLFPDDLSSLYYGNVSLLCMLMDQMTTMNTETSRFISTSSAEITELPTDSDSEAHDNNQKDDDLFNTDRDQHEAENADVHQSSPDVCTKNGRFPATINNDSNSGDDSHSESEFLMSLADDAPNIAPQRPIKNKLVVQEKRVNKSTLKLVKLVAPSKTVGKKRPIRKEMVRELSSTNQVGQTDFIISDKGYVNKSVDNYIATRNSTLATSLPSHDNGTNAGRAQRKHHITCTTRPHIDQNRTLPQVYPASRTSTQKETIVPTASPHHGGISSSRPDKEDFGNGRCQLPPINRPTALYGNQKHARIGYLQPPRVSKGLRAPARLLPPVIPSQKPKQRRSHPLAIRRPFTPASRDVLASRALWPSLAPGITMDRTTELAGRATLLGPTLRLPPVTGGERDRTAAPN